MKVLAILGFCLVMTQAFPSDDLAREWDLYKRDHHKHYEGAEDTKRFNIYVENLKRIAQHNEDHANGVVSFRVAVNQFTDMTEAEVNAVMNGFKASGQRTGTPYVDDGRQADATVDWRNKGAVTPVKNQGQCGSCWSFSTTGSLEGQHALKKGKLVSLSEQNLVDCSGNYGNQGCDGGIMDQAFEYIKANGGIDTEKSYPYTAEDGSCRFKKNNVGATVSGHVDIPQGDENSLMNAVSKIGPISVAIDASNWSFQTYAGGVYDEPQCSTEQLDHGVLVVGYGSENGKDYWLVKNSWGPQWGESGYIKMTRNGNNQCGIASMASYPTV